MNLKYKAFFCKKGDMVYISHLDLMALFRRAIRRAELPFFLTGGFSPRVKISMPGALKLGIESEKEELTIVLTEPVPPATIAEKLNKCLPEGIHVLGVQI